MKWQQKQVTHSFFTSSVVLPYVQHSSTSSSSAAAERAKVVEAVTAAAPMGYKNELLGNIILNYELMEEAHCSVHLLAHVTVLFMSIQ